jgi:hypothetical protein
MNTLFIIGNGFDLAHGLEIRYEDFIFWLIKKHLPSDMLAMSKKEEVALLGNYSITSPFRHLTVGQLSSLVQTELQKHKSIIDLKTSLLNNIRFIFSGFSFHNRIIDNSIKQFNSDENWSDIEWQYFQILREGNYGIKKLNQDLEFLRQELSIYLKEIEAQHTLKDAIKKQYNNIFDKYTKGESLLVSFNYTKTIGHYYDRFQDSTVQIHGNLKNSILGYGDETTEEYKTLENKNSYEHIRFMKSSQYKRDDSYDKVHLFINQQTPKSVVKIDGETHDDVPFQVVVLGHSCGLSDRVLLKEIFEKSACKAIHVYHYSQFDEDEEVKQTDFFHTLANISRHFDDKVKMRSKVQSFDSKNRMPQWNDELEN